MLPRARPRSWTVSLLICAILAIAGYPILRKHVELSPSGSITVSSDVLVYVDAARHMLEGEEIYDRPGEFPYVYPPFYAALNIPLVGVDPLALDVAWYLLNVGLLCAILHMAYFLFTGAPFTSLSPRDQWLLAGLPILFTLRYLVRNAQQANVNLVIVFLVVLGLFLVHRTGKAYWASLIGIAAAIKILPALFFAYFLFRRQWKELGFALVAFLAATFFPSLIVGFEKNWEYLESFSAYLQRRLSPSGVAVENFSLWGTLGRVLSRQVAFTIPGEGPSYVNIANLSLHTIQYVVYVLNVFLIALVCWVSPKTATPGEDSWLRSGRAIVVTLLTMNLVSVLIEDHHTVGFVVAHLFLLVAWRTGAGGGPPWVAGMFAAGILSNLISHDAIVPIFGKRAYLTCLAFGLPVLPVAFILLTLTLRSMSSGGARTASAR